jgi:peptide/nickel transport system permease protein
VTDALAKRVKTSPVRTWWRVLKTDRLALVSALYLLTVLAVCIFAYFFLSDVAREQNLRNGLQSPSFSGGFKDLLGTDVLGRSVSIRVLVGGALTMLIALTSVGLAALVGGLVGLVAGLSSRWVESSVMRVADVLLGLPSILLAVFALYVLGTSVVVLIAVLSISRVGVFLRIGRAECTSIRERPYISAAKVLGARRTYLLVRHVIPAASPTILTVAALDVSVVMLAESALSFLGVGVQPPQATWGTLVSDGRDFLSNAWWLATLPGIAIASTAVALNLLANWFRLALDPQQRARLLRKGKSSTSRVSNFAGGAPSGATRAIELPEDDTR